ncbi:hypothetical protein [Ancrocorticia populi]|uniref:hypothetical protein n=1 Tax=Ancrocorticia populi TaxID=2175228 RepID=UPI001402E36D|nr:hypothetical protein [Ancrocorticia populi]
MRRSKNPRAVAAERAAATDRGPGKLAVLLATLTALQPRKRRLRDSLTYLMVD